MEEQLKLRLEQLKQEYQNGQQQLVEKEAEVNSLRQTLLRIAGAIQVLEEMLKQGV